MKDVGCWPLGMFAWFSFDLPLVDRLQMLRQAGFHATSLWWDGRHERHAVPQLVRDAGLLLDNIHVPFDDCNDFWSDDAAAREAIVTTHLGWIEECARHQAPRMVMHVTRGAALPAPNGYGLRCLERLVAAAEAAQITLAVENTRRRDYLDFLFHEIPSPHLGFCYDSSHDWLYSAQKAALLRDFGDRLVTTHFSDNDGEMDRHWLPGSGIVDWQQIARHFPTASYRGNLFLEVLPRRSELAQPPEEFVRKAYTQAVALAEKIAQVRDEG